jgi:hypothetical protein
MWRTIVLAFFSALIAALVLKFTVLQLTMPVPFPRFWLNSIIAPSLLIVAGIIYSLTNKSEQFPGLLLAVMVIRLLICLTYVLVISFLEKTIFKNMALQFFFDFVIYTTADVWMAGKFLKKQEH